MNIKDKKYQTLVTIGFMFSFLPNLILNFLKIDVPSFVIWALIGFGFGWVGGTWLLRFLILKEEAKDAKYKSDKNLEKLEDLSNKN